MTSKNDIFDQLVANALDFLSQSVADISSKPKYAVIHFYAAAELFLKARLVREHWSLCVTSRQEPDWDKFKVGDFNSVSLEEAQSRLTKAVKAGLTIAEMASLRELRSHRNKMVHFVHEVTDEEENQQLVRKIVKQQLTAWYFLHNVLVTRWAGAFEDWAEEIGQVNSELRKNHSYLTVIFDQIKEQIEAFKAEGFIFSECPSCEFDSFMHSAELDELYDSSCLVCQLKERCINIECPHCVEVVRFEGEGFAECGNCSNKLEPDVLVEALTDQAAAHMAIQNGEDYLLPANCSDCDGFETIVELGDEQYLCACCFAEFDALYSCEWCNNLQTDELEFSFWSGCEFCDGKAGWDRGK